MDCRKIVKRLPVRPRLHMEEDVASHCREWLGPDFCLFRRVSSAQCVDFAGWPDYDDREQAPPKWVAECTCGVCGETWHSGWNPGRGIMLILGADDIPRPGVPVGEDWEWDTGVPVAAGEHLECPMCGAKVQLIHRSDLKNGRYYRIAVGSMENVGAYTVVVKWMAERYIGSDGVSTLILAPQAAALIDEAGKLVFFSYSDCAWKYRKSCGDPFQLFYQTHGGVPGRTIGAWLWPDVPDQTGQTGEKTGLAEYFVGGGRWPILYLRLWQESPAVENLLKAGWLKPFEESIDAEVMNYTQAQVGVYQRRALLYAPKDYGSLADWSSAKPHEMLCMTREEVRAGYGQRWTADQLDLWIGIAVENLAGPGDAAFFDRCCRDYGLAAMQRWADYADEGRLPASLEQLDRYFYRQHQKHDLPLVQALVSYLDYIDALDAPPDELTDIQIFPPSLRAAHDRATAARAAEADAQTIAGFDAIRKRWHDLEYSDGRICAVLPRANSDLVREGQLLRHCVGGYGKPHTEGKIIVFIRHARRPERSWYTLNIDLTGPRWTEIQLHGYGNEWAHGKRLTIPREVREFVDRWEKEVLTPTFAKVKATEKKKRVRVVA